MEQMRIVKEMRERERETGRTGWMVRPRYMVWENVPGAFSSGNPKGADFAAVIEEIIKVAEPGAAVSVCVPNGGWTKSGCYYAEDGSWSLAWRVHDAQFWGVPQRRKRIALVCDFGGLSAPEILFERKGLSGDSEQSGEAGEETAGTAGEDTDKAIGQCLDGSQTVSTLTANNAGGNQRMPDKDNFNAVIQGIKREAVCIGNWQLNNISMMDQANTLNTIDRPAVYDARGNGDGKTVCTITGDHENRVTDYTALVQNSVARRLTPLECERLQGYPDGWTDIGEWVDSKGKKHGEADSPRYKALGNSIALPFWQWMARRICAQYERPVTMASLFDGIGGFPLVFRRCGAVPVWASEIEEFPIAVTKVRFPDESV